ncbi:hypothetical protein [Rhodococcus jostii]|uniref:hypothetical protein n=1 Tax=Rhodococcus jostii TaxID=132919 RepID=UPI003656CA0A
MLQVSECYVGGDLDRLVEGCRSLDIEQNNPFGGPDIYDWADSVRRTSGSGGWVTVASLYRRGTERKWMDDIAADLPEDFERVRLKAISPMPSVVVLLATFTLSNASSNALNDELNTNRYLRVENVGTGLLYHSAVHRKQAAIADERTRVREAASRWVARKFPGTITTDFKKQSLPAIEVITTKQAVPFTRHNVSDISIEEISRSLEDYRHLLSIDNEGDAYSSSYTPNWKVATHFRPHDDPWTIVCGHKLTDEELRSDGITFGGDYTDDHFIEQQFGGLMARWSVKCLIECYEGTIAQVRDDLARSPRTAATRWNVIKQIGQNALRTATIDSLEQASKLLSDTIFDATIVSREVGKWVSDDRRWTYELDEYKQVYDWGDGQVDELFFDKMLRASLEDSAEWFGETVPLLRSELELRTSIESTAANFRLQQIAMMLAILAIVISVVAIVLQG